MSVLGLLTSASSGGLVGLIGSVASKGFSIFDKLQDIKEKKIDYQHELDLFDKQAALKTAEMENELAITQSSGDREAQVASYTQDTNIGVPSQIIINMLRLVRPFLTLVLVLFLGVIYYNTPEGELRTEIVDNIVFCAATSLTWWFGSRPVDRNK